MGKAPSAETRDFHCFCPLTTRLHRSEVFEFKAVVSQQTIVNRRSKQDSKLSY